MVALDERRRPRAVHVPEQDPHAGTAFGCEPVDGADDRLGASTSVQARMAGHRAGARAAAGARARRRQQLVRHPPRAPADRRDRRARRARRPASDRRGEVRRAGVADDDRVGAGEHAAPARRGSSARRGRCRARRRRTRSASRSPGPPVTTTRPVEARDELRGCARATRRAPAPTRPDGRPRSPGAQLGRAAVTLDGRPVVGGRGEARGADEVEARARPRARRRRSGGAGRAASPGSRPSRADPRDAGEPQQQRGRQRALVEGGEDHRAVDAERGDPRDERVDVAAVDGWRVGVDPRRAPDEHVVDARAAARAAGAARAAEQRDAVGARGDRADRRPGEQHVAVVVEPDGEHVAVTPRHGTVAVGAARREPEAVERVGQVAGALAAPPRSPRAA